MTKLSPGQYEWHPERSPSGPLLVVVSIDDQMAYVFRNGVQIAKSTVSTGRKGKETPTGVFRVLQRKREHESSIYKGAQMPNMQRLTWGGIAMHAGDLPGYPASAGCVRMPLGFSSKIYGIMQNGSTVVITKKTARPSVSSKPASILLASKATDPTNKAIPESTGKWVWEPQKSPAGPISILVSYADETVYVWRNGVRIGQAPVDVKNATGPLPEGVFLMLEGSEAPDPRLPGIQIRPWTALSLQGGAGGSDAVARMRGQIGLPMEFRKKVSKVLTPGTILVATKRPNNNQTRSQTGFQILGTE